MPPSQLPQARLAITVPSGEAFARRIASLVLRAFHEVYPPERFPSQERLLQPEAVVFLPQEALRARELAERNPRESVTYQMLQAAGVPAEFLAEYFQPAADSAGVYYDILAPQPVVYTDAAVLAALSCPEKLERAHHGLVYGRGFIITCLRLLPLAQKVPVEQRPRVQAQMLRRLTEECDALAARYPEQVEPARLQQGLRSLEDLLASPYAHYVLYGASILVFSQGKRLQFEHEIGQELHIGVLWLLAERVWERFLAQFQATFWVRPKENEVGRTWAGSTFRAEQTLRQIGLRQRQALWEAYVHSEIALHYWAAESRKVDPWSYPR